MPTSWSLIFWWSLTFVGRTRAALHRGENTHFGDFEFFYRQFSAGTSMLRLSWSFLQAWVFIEISKIVLCAIPKRFIAVGFRNDEIWFKNRKLAWVHLGNATNFGPLEYIRILHCFRTFPLFPLAPSNVSGPVRAQSSRIQLARSPKE